MVKQLLNSVIAKYRNFSGSRRSIIWRRLRQITDLLATDKSRCFPQPLSIIVNYHWISLYPPDNWIGFLSTYPVHRDLSAEWHYTTNQPLNLKLDGYDHKIWVLLLNLLTLFGVHSILWPELLLWILSRRWSMLLWSSHDGLQPQRLGKGGGRR